MRIDLISQNVYGSTDYCDFILDFNMIDNPLNIMANDMLVCPDIGAFEDFQISNSQVVSAQNQLLNINKSTQIDPTRQNYVQQNYSLPPSFKQVPSQPVQVVGNQVVIGG